MITTMISKTDKRETQTHRYDTGGRAHYIAELVISLLSLCVRRIRYQKRTDQTLYVSSFLYTDES